MASSWREHLGIHTCTYMIFQSASKVLRLEVICQGESFLMNFCAKWLCFIPVLRRESWVLSVSSTVCHIVEWPWASSPVRNSIEDHPSCCVADVVSRSLSESAHPPAPGNMSPLYTEQYKRSAALLYIMSRYYTTLQRRFPFVYSEVTEQIMVTSATRSMTPPLSH